MRPRPPGKIGTPIAWLSAVSAVAWFGVAALAQTEGPVQVICGLTGPGAGSAAGMKLQLLLGRWPQVVLSVALMAAAMMSPALSGPMLHLWHRSLARDRWRAIALFVASFLAVWTAASVALLALAQVFSDSPLHLGALGAAAAAWHVSPIKRACLKRCHLRPRLSIFGVRAIVDPFVFGLSSAGWCVATCWAWMLLAFGAGPLHLLVMGAASAIAVLERSPLWDPRPDAGPWRRLWAVAGARVASFGRSGWGVRSCFWKPPTTC